MANLQLVCPVETPVAQTESTAWYHVCLVTEYMSYMEAAGYSISPAVVEVRRRGAWKFLNRFPHPEDWLYLPLEEQIYCRPSQRSFVHYLFLRHVFPMPPKYILIGHHRLAEMACRLKERETYYRYQEMGRRLGYTEPTVRRQFQALVYLMAWAQKPMDALTPNDADAFVEALKVAQQELEEKGRIVSLKDGLPFSWNAGLREVRKVLFHLGIFPRESSRRRRSLNFSQRWADIPPNIRDTAQRYLQQLALVRQPGSLAQEEGHLRRFFSWLVTNMPEVTEVNQTQRCHIEAFKEYLRWAPPLKSNRAGATLGQRTAAGILSSLRYFFCRIAEWGWPEAPNRPLVFQGDFPVHNVTLPRFLGEAKAASFLQVARTHPDLFTRVCGVTLLRTGLRKGEFLNLTADCIVQIGSSYWLRVPLGKTHRDRYIPLHPEVKQVLEDWISYKHLQRPTDFLFSQYGRRIGHNRVYLAVQRIAKAAGIPDKVSPHRLRHTIATLAINRGMALESIAALLGHRSLSMTLVYARIGHHTLQKEYSAVSRQLDLLCGSLTQGQERRSLPNIAEGPQMRRLRQETHWRLLGNGYCMRPEGVPCEYENICESCSCFFTTRDFLPTLRRQKVDAESKGQTHRAQIFSQLIQRVENSNELCKS